jgi:hypothetical protein
VYLQDTRVLPTISSTFPIQDVAPPTPGEELVAWWEGPGPLPPKTHLTKRNLGTTDLKRFYEENGVIEVNVDDVVDKDEHKSRKKRVIAQDMFEELMCSLI